jgi:hypothetical protein
MFGGPLSSLYYKGFFPCCCLKEEDKTARDALLSLNAVGARIVWQRPRSKFVENVKKAAFSFFSSNKKKQDEDDDSNPLVQAQFKLVDNAQGIPEIRLAKRGVVMEDENNEEDKDWEFGGFKDEESVDASQQQQQQQSKKKKPQNDANLKIDIALKRIHTVVPVEHNWIVLNILDDSGQTTKEWCRFTLDASQDQAARNMFVMHLQVLMEWDKQRRNSCGELEYDETSAASSLKARAQRAAHFARREIEMKQTKRSREERKAKYVQESGGLKYTALAMARNAADPSS